MRTRPTTRCHSLTLSLLLLGITSASESAPSAEGQQLSNVGLSAVGGRLLVEPSAGGGNPAALDRFGFALAGGDFDGDGVDDLVFGVPGQDNFDGSVDMGMLGVLYGAPGWPSGTPAGGFNLNARSWWWEDLLPSFPPLVAQSVEHDLFGQALAVADFNRDGFDDLAVGVPGNDAFFVDRGRVYVLAGNPGLNLWPIAPIETGFAGVPGPTWEESWAQQAAGFGSALAVGDFDASGHPDLAVGLSNYDLPGAAEAGAALVLRGSLFADGFESALVDAWPVAAP